jgi:RNA polymerase sigma factor (sigma-70 family)
LLKMRPLRRADAFVPYLRRTIVRTAASRWRSERRDAGRMERVQRMDGASPTAMLDDVDDELLAAVRRLPARQRSVIVLRYWLDWSELDIADVLGCRPGTVKSLASRALDTLRSGLDDA